MKQLVIIGAGRFGREVYSWAAQSVHQRVEWTIKGFLDDRQSILDRYAYPVGVIASPEEYEPQPEDVFSCALGDPLSKQKYVEMLGARGAHFVSIIHPSVVLGHNVEFGEGVILCPLAVVSSDVRLGRFVTVNFHVSVGHDVRIGDFSQVHPHACLGGGCDIGERVTVGSNSTLLPDALVESDAVVGAGTVVLKRVHSGDTVFGVPARRMPSARPRGEAPAPEGLNKQSME